MSQRVRSCLCDRVTYANTAITTVDDDNIKLVLSTKEAKYRKEATVVAAKRVHGKTELAVKDGVWCALVHVASDKDIR